MISVKVNAIGTIDAAGRAEATVSPPTQGESWDIERISCESDLGATGCLAVYDGPETPMSFVSAGLNATNLPGITGSFNPPIHLTTGRYLTLVATGLTGFPVGYTLSFNVWYLRDEVPAGAKNGTCAVCGGEPGYAHQHDGPESADAPDAQDLYDRDPLEHGGVGSLRRDAGPRDGGILPILPSDPSTAAGSDLF